MNKCLNTFKKDKVSLDYKVIIIKCPTYSLNMTAHVFGCNYETATGTLDDCSVFCDHHLSHHPRGYW